MCLYCSTSLWSFWTFEQRRAEPKLDNKLLNLFQGGGGARLTGHIQIEGDAAQLRQTLQDIENRHEMFIKLETSIKELHEMFMDISVLIENQGEMVNRIDAHVESAVEYTTRATNDTKKALEYQQKARRKKIMMLLCVIIGGSLGTYMGLKYIGFVQKFASYTFIVMYNCYNLN